MTQEYVTYLLKVVSFHAISYALYWVLLRKSKYFSLNRAYLIITLVLGFIAPLVSLPGVTLPSEIMLSEIRITPGVFVENPGTGHAPLRSEFGDYIPVVLLVMYVTGVIVLAGRCMFTLILIARLRQRGVEVPSSWPRIIRLKGIGSFTFINTIFLDDNADETILRHEEGHVKGKHWIDLVFLEIICIVCWMNPFVWLYRMSLRQQHEYLADNYVLQNGVTINEYLLCILSSISNHEPIGPVHKFNSKSLKQRIVMITKEKFSPYTKVCYAGVLSVIALLFFSFSIRKGDVGVPTERKVFVIDAAHGGDDIGGMSASGVTEKQVSLSIALLVQEIGTQRGLDIRLTRSKDQGLTLQERVDISRKAEADAFLSLHLGFESDGTKKGLDMFISENKNSQESKRIASVLHQELKSIRELGEPDVHNSNAYVLKNNDAPGAIVEIGYLSDVNDTKFVSDVTNQKNIAEAIVRALIKY